MKANSSLSQMFAEATQAHRAGRPHEAEALYRRIIAQAPDHADAHHLLGLLYSQQGDQAKAVRHIRRAIAIDGNNPIFHNNLGEVWRRWNKLDKAVGSYWQALSLDPDLADAHYNLANVLRMQGHLKDAIHHYQRAVQLRPNYTKAYYNLGNALLEQGRFKSAMACYQRAIQLAPQFAEAHNNLGVTLKEWDQVEEAIRSYQQAMRIKPDFAEAHRNLGQALEKQGNIVQARQAYEKALALEPENDLSRLHVETLCPVIPASNEEIDRYRAGLMEALERYRGRNLRPDLSQLHRSGGEPPSELIYQGHDDRPIKEKWARLFAGRLPTLSHTVGKGQPHVGFVVTHGHEGVFMKCMRGLINHLPGEQFRLTIVCSQQGGEQILRRAIANPTVQYLPLPGRFDQALERLKEARFDLLHYWEVGTDVTNYFLPFCRPAPVQCATWGWPVTTGIPQMDYFLSCQLLETDESHAHYTETLVRFKRLPTYYYRPPAPETLPPRSRFGLTKHQHLYLCSQNLRKVHPDLDHLAAEILRCDPQGSLFFIEDKQSPITDLLRRRLQAAMPDVAGRVRFLPRMAEADYLSLVARADVVLDTLHYGGGANTTYDAFAAGTPVVTLPTCFHRGRYADAAYRQMGLLDCVAGSAEAYVEIALRLGTNPDYRAAISAKIAEACPVLFEDRAAVTELAEFFEEALARGREV